MRKPRKLGPELERVLKTIQNGNFPLRKREWLRARQLSKRGLIDYEGMSRRWLKSIEGMMSTESARLVKRLSDRLARPSPFQKLLDL